MAARVNSVAFLGFQVLDVDVQVHMSAGLPAFTRVGLPSVLCSVRTPRSAFSYKRTLGAPFRNPLDYFRVPHLQTRRAAKRRGISTRTLYRR